MIQRENSIEVSKQYVDECLSGIVQAIEQIQDDVRSLEVDRIPLPAPLFLPMTPAKMDRPPFISQPAPRMGGFLKSAGCGDNPVPPCEVIIQIACFLLSLCDGLHEM